MDTAEHDHDVGIHGFDHGSDAVGWAIFTWAVVLVLVLAAVAYAAALWAARSRSPWPASRSALWFAGLACAGAGLVGPIAVAARESFSAHMVGHLLLGMIAPLLLVLAAPVALALRALPVSAARSLTRILRTPWFRIVTNPIVAAALNAGGLWILYTTDLYRLMHTSVPVHALVHLHLFLAGYLLTFSLVGVDPDPHRASMPVRSAVLVAFIAAHTVLAKWLYAHPPAGVPAGDAHAGAQVMYYGGDVVDVALIVLLFAKWYSATRPRETTERGAPRTA